MNSPTGTPNVSQQLCHDQGKPQEKPLLRWVRDTFTDLDRRADALLRLVDSTEPMGIDATDGDQTTVIVLMADHAAWSAAVDAAHAPRPGFPGAE